MSQAEVLGHHPFARPEAYVPDPPERGDVLILLADRLAASLDLYLAGALGKLRRRHLPSLVGEQRVQQAHGDRRGGSESRARRRHIGQGGDLDSVRYTGHQHGLADKLVLQLLDVRDNLFPGVVDVDVVVEALFHDDVYILVERAVEDPAAVLEVVGGQVGSAAEQADAQRRLCDDHDMTREGHSSLARR